MTLQDIVSTIQGYAPNADTDLVWRAYLFSANAHRGQTRHSGEEYLIHPIAVAAILAELHMDVDTIATGLLHDTMEDCLTTREELEHTFNKEVAELVEGVTKIGKLEFRSQEEAQAENFRKLVLAMSRDIRVILIKLADRLHNMRTMEHMKAERAAAISRETLDIFAPIANRLGLSRLKSELEDLCFRYLETETWQDLTEKLGATRAEREAYTDRACEALRAWLEAGGLAARVNGRPKHLYSVYRKMQAQGLDFEQIHDLTAFRVIVDDIGQCYTALGLLHGGFRHHPDRLKDYIANPKSNGYQSLHTVIIGPEAQLIEVQIRTRHMHEVSEVGIAAHWRYKEGHLALSKEEIDKIARLRNLFEAAREVEDPNEFLETVKVDLFANEIFVFTPKGDVKIFPQGATALDFAYAIHTEVGNSTYGAKVNGRMVPLRHELNNGDSIEILTRTGQKPSRDWIQFARTGRALSKIRRSLREEEREKGRTLGQEMVERGVKQFGFNLQKLIKAGKLEETSHKLGHRHPDTLYLAVAQGHLSIKKVLRELLGAEVVDKEEEAEPGAWTTLIRKITRPESPVVISGEEDVLVSFARCCSPLPGETVAGYITRGRGITVHRSSCPQLQALEPERRIPVQWQRGAKARHHGELSVLCANKPGMLADLGGICKQLDINVTRMEARSLEDEKALLTLEVSVEDVDQLTRLMKGISRLKGVVRVDRVNAGQPAEG